MADGFLSLRHDTVVDGHDQNGDVGHVGSASAHLGKGFVARSIDKGDGMAVSFNLIGSNVLGDAAFFARNDVNADNPVQERGFSVVDVSQEGNNRRTRLEQSGIIVFFVDGA